MVDHVSAVMILGIQSYNEYTGPGREMYKHTQSWHEGGGKLGVFWRRGHGALCVT